MRRLLRRAPAPPRLGIRDVLEAFDRAHPYARFAEIGANDGEQHDHLRPYLSEGRWRGVMVEPVPYVFGRLQRNYAGVEGVALENAAITDHDGTVQFFHLVDASEDERAELPDWYDGIGSLDKGFLLKHAKHMPDIEQRIVERTVPALTFESLLVKHGLADLDLLVIDVEGADWHVLRHIDLERWRPELVVFEHFHLTPAERAAAKDHLQTAGYATREEGFDTLGLGHTASPDLQRAFEHVGQEVPGVYVEDDAIRRLIGRRSDPGPDPDLPLHDDSVPLPPGAEQELRPDHPRLQDLRERYAQLDVPVTTASRWSDTAIDGFLDLQRFRGETLFMWHYREEPRITELKYFVFGTYVRQHDHLDLLDRLTEDGAFGCWRFDFRGHGTYSRDLLESVNELSFLDRELAVGEGARVLDIGAGYGRLAHRFTEAFPKTVDYCCVDAIPESTFVSEFYLRFRQAAPPARVVALDEVDSLEPGAFDLAVNIHSFSECPHDAVAWWARQLQRLGVPRLLVVPNDGTELLTLEPDGSRRDFAPLLADAGYERVTTEPVITDPAVRDLLQAPDDHFHLFALRER